VNSKNQADLQRIGYQQMVPRGSSRRCVICLQTDQEQNRQGAFCRTRPLHHHN